MARNRRSAAEMDRSVASGHRQSGRVAMVLTIILVLSVLAAGGIWFALTYFETPPWDEVRQEALPLAQPEGGQPAREEGTTAASPPGVDPRVAQIAENLNKQFARNIGQETAFTDAFPRRALQSWINDRAGIPVDMREHFIDSLIVASRGIGEDPMINRISSVPDRVKSIQDALFAYRDEYLRRAEAASQRTAAAKRQPVIERAEEAARANGDLRERPPATERREGTGQTEADLRDFFRSFERGVEGASADVALRRLPPATKVGPSMGHFLILGIGMIALAIMVLLLFMGKEKSAPSRVDTQE